MGFNYEPLHQLRIGDVVRTYDKNYYTVQHVGPLRAALKPLSRDRNPSWGSRLQLVRSAELERAFNAVQLAEYRVKATQNVELALSALTDGLRWVELARTRAKDNPEELDLAVDTLTEVQEKLLEATPS